MMGRDSVQVNMAFPVTELISHHTIVVFGWRSRLIAKSQSDVVQSFLGLIHVPGLS